MSDLWYAKLLPADDAGMTRNCGCAKTAPFLMCCSLARDDLAQESYNHSTRRAMLGKEWGELSTDEQAGWIRRATEKLCAR